MRQAAQLHPLVGQHRHLGWCGLLLLLLVSLLAPIGRVHAQTAGCMEDGSSSTAQGIIKFSPPASIALTSMPAAGTVLWSSGTIAASPAPIYDCSGNVPFGVLNNVGATPTSGTTFPTGVPGLSYQLVRGGTNLVPWSTGSYASSGNGCTWYNGYGWYCANGYSTVTFSVSTQLNLVVTGPIASGSVLNAGTLGYWQYQGLGSNGAVSPVQIIAFTLGNSTTITFPTCTVTTSSISVTLPDISASALGSLGATAGAAPFSIGLNCPSTAAGAPVYVEMNYNGTASGIQGVLTPTAGTSSGVGVQLLYSNTAVTFGTPTQVGTTTTGTMSIPYTAQYYQTQSAAVTPGTLTASATFVIMYE